MITSQSPQPLSKIFSRSVNHFPLWSTLQTSMHASKTTSMSPFGSVLLDASSIPLQVLILPGRLKGAEFPGLESLDPVGRD